jgi:membrane protein YqaA with SNARE-associated domain
MPAAAHLAHKAAHHSPMPRWLIHYGALGLFTVALLDASPIPLAIPGSADILLLLLAAHRDSHPVFLALTTIVGSVIGGYLTWGMGKKGGETMVARYAPKRLLEPLTRWVEHRGFLALVVAGLAPPPTPLLPLLLAAGALGCSRRQYFTAFTLARGIRYSFVAWVGATYGRRVLRVWNNSLAGWSNIIVWSFIGLMVAAILFGVWKYRREQQGWQASSQQAGSPEPVPATD